MRRRLFCVLMAMGLFISGCALSPQNLVLQPVLKEQNLNPVGQGQAIQLQVVDGRADESMGTRGGVYANSSVLTVSRNDIVPKLQQEAEKALRLMGFVPSAQAPRQMTLTLTTLNYRSPDAPYVTQADIDAVLQAEVRSGGKHYTGRYSASLNQRFAKAPNAEKNSELVSDVLSDALTRVFKDAAIGQTLSQ